MSRTAVGTLAVLLAALLACDVEPSPLPYPRVGILSSDSAGAPVPTIAAAACVLLPVLRGSEVDKSFPISGSLALAVSATRDGAQVRFESSNPPVSTLVLTRGQLEHGFSQQVELYDENGAHFVVLVSSECQHDAGTW